MASVVDTSVKHFHNGMVGAPVLSGTAGALAAILDACLVTGFDTKTATSLVVSGGVATLSFSGTHSSAVDSVILVSGVTGALTALNGEQKITTLGSGLVKFATAAADGAAGGAISFKMAAANWTSPFTGTNLRVYKSADVASTGMNLRVDDTGTTTARVVGYESMTDVNTGLGAFPTSAQMSGGGYWSKSGTASAVARRWVLIADGRGFLLHVGNHWNGTTVLGGMTRGFGDIEATRPGGDAYACYLNYSILSDVSSQFDGTLDGSSASQNAFPRSYTGLGSSELSTSRPFTGSNSSPSGIDTTMGAFPSPIDGGLRLSRRYFSLATAAPRGTLPGLLHVPMTGAFDTFKTLDVVPGSGALAGRKLLALNGAFNNITSVSTASSTGATFVDITGPWR